MAYFSTDFRLKIFLYLFLNIQLYDISAILPVSIIVTAGFFVLLASFAVRLEKGGKIQTQAYFRSSLPSGGGKRRPEIRLHSQARCCTES